MLRCRGLGFRVLRCRVNGCSSEVSLRVVCFFVVWVCLALVLHGSLGRAALLDTADKRRNAVVWLSACTFESCDFRNPINLKS